MKEKRWVKYLCLFALALVLALSAAGTKQAQAATKNGSCGDKATYTYDTSTKTLTISGSGTVEAPSYWDKISGSVKKLVVGDKITDIGTYTEWSALKTVSLGAKVKKINAHAFEYCSSLTTVDMGSSAVTKIGEGAFNECYKLKTVTFSTKLTTISQSAFCNCSELTSVSLPSSLKTIGNNAFSGAGLTKVTIPKNVTSIGTGVFDTCQSLTKIAVSSGNTKYSAKSGVLYNKAKTKLICYPAAKSGSSFTVPSSVTTIADSAFSCVQKLKKINTNKVKKIERMAFWSCDSLATVTLTSSLKTIGIYAFWGCESLKKITIPQNVTSIGSYVFEQCPNLTKIAVKSGNTKYSAKDGVLFNKAKTKLICYPASKSGTSYTIPSTVKTIAFSAFSFNKNLKSVTIGSSVTTIKAMAFYGCTKLKTVVIGANVKTIGAAAFSDCTALTAVRFKGSAPSIDCEGFGEEYANEDNGGMIFSNVTATIKYPSSEKSSWTKAYRSALNKGAKDGGGKLTFEAY